MADNEETVYVSGRATLKSRRQTVRRGVKEVMVHNYSGELVAVYRRTTLSLVEHGATIPIFQCVYHE